MTDRFPRRRRVMTLRIAMGVVAAIAAGGDVVALMLWKQGRLTTIDLSTLLIVCTVICIAAAGTALTYSPGRIPDTGKSLKESFEGSLSWRLLGNVVSGFGWTSFGTIRSNTAFNEGDLPMAYMFAALVLLWASIAPAALMGWAPGFRRTGNDPDHELNRAFRSRATATGFWTLLAGGGATYLISMETPEAVRWLLPFALWLGGSIACIHFAWLHYRADRDLEDDG